jgi:NADH:ubiquinone oxidoreductase subunit 6 (subunit J)
MAIAVFYLAGAVAIGSAIAVVIQRNPFLAALTLILHLAALAALYLDLQGDFVAVAQLLVYAGAVMVMFLFVIAYLGDRADLDLRRGGLGAGAAGIAGLAIFVETLIAVSDSGDALSSPAGVAESFGSPATIGRLFLTDHLLAFEAISLILLVGAIAGVVLGAGDLLPARPRAEAGDAPDGDAPERDRFDLRREFLRRESEQEEQESEARA